MKNLLLITIALFTLQATAQKSPKKGNQKERMHKMQDFTPEEVAKLQTKKMTLDLDLTQSQQKEIEKINLENARDRKTKMEARKKHKESAKTERPSKEERLSMMNERLDKQIKAKAKMKQILNADQYAKWEESKAMKKQRFSKKRKSANQKREMQKQD